MARLNNDWRRGAAIREPIGSGLRVHWRVTFAGRDLPPGNRPRLLSRSRCCASIVGGEDETPLLTTDDVDQVFIVH
jgi:hypothetical protein